MYELNLVVVGNGGVGKTALTMQFCENKFVEEYDSTIEDLYRKQMVIDDEEYILEILDTAGQEEYLALRDSYCRRGQGFLIVYSVTDHDTFETLNGFREQILRVKEDNSTPIIIVGNKADLTQLRQVEFAEGKEWAQTHNCSFVETSAKTRLNVIDAYFLLVRDVRKHLKKKKRKEKFLCIIL